VSRFVAVGVAIALVLCGVIVGALGTYLILEGRGHREERWGPPPSPHPPGPLPGPFTREMEDRLGLSRDQLDKIHAILDDSRDKADAMRRELRPRLEAHLEETRTKIAGVLDPEQRKKFEAMVEENKARADRFMLDGPPPPPPFGGPPPPPPR
jgi:Spy/CpxP family protein refolding chaperone